MADDPIPAQPVPLATKKRSRLMPVMLATLVLLLLAIAALEWLSASHYAATITALEHRIEYAERGGPTPTLQDVLELSDGWPPVGMTAQGDTFAFRWWSLFRELTLLARISPNGELFALAVGPHGVLEARQTAAVESAPVESDVDANGYFETSPSGVTLELRTPATESESVAQGRLEREIVRQALLIAARDQLGLPTRDRFLGETIPAERAGATPVLDVAVSIDANRQLHVVVTDQARSPAVPVAEFEVPVPEGELIDELVTRAEALSTDEFVAVLAKAGFAGSERPFLPEGPVAEVIRRDLAKFDMLAQYAAVRALHGEMRRLGESAERLGALARGYAHLGATTRFLWSPLHKLFEARGLLYAERLMRRDSGSAAARWNRAYVRALVGLPASALADLAAAKALEPDGEPPEWLPPVDAFCRGDVQRLVTLSEDREAGPLAAYLRLVTAKTSASQRMRAEAAQRLLAVVPGSLDAFDATLSAAPRATQQSAAASAMSAFGAAIRQQLPAMAEMPAEITKFVNESEVSGDLMTVRARLVAALRESGRIGRDAGEPSRAALATLIEQVSYIDVMRMLKLQQHSAPAGNEGMAELRPILGRVPRQFVLFLEGYLGDPLAEAEKRRALARALKPWELELNSAAILDVIADHVQPRETATAWIQTAAEAIVARSDRTFFDLSRVLSIRASDEVKARAAAALREIAPLSPVGVVGAIKYDWNAVQGQAPLWEVRFGNDPDVLAALARRYLDLNRSDDAERCLKRRIEVYPEQIVYQTLAALYRERGDDERWFETLTASLKQASLGPQHIDVRIELARHHMRRREWDKARPHVERAAESQTRAALVCAVDFHELTGDLKKAETFVQMLTAMYPEDFLEWYKWCRRTGHGDVNAARQRVEPFLMTQLSRFPTGDARSILGMFHVLEDRPAEGLKSFREAWGFERNPHYSLHAALLADELGQPALRDELLDEARISGIARSRDLVELVHFFKRCLADGPQGPLDLPSVEWAIRDDAIKGNNGAAGTPTAGFYFVGKFLAGRGSDLQALEYLRRAATSSHASRFEGVMAAHALLKRGVPVGERRFTQFDDETAQALTSLRKGSELAERGDLDQALAACSESIRRRPDFADAFVLRGAVHQRREEFEPAAADFTRAHELLPRVPRFLVRRGQVHEFLGRYAFAVADYEAALEIDSQYGSAHHDLAWLRAACPDAEFRDGRSAIAHAEAALALGETPRHMALELLAAAHAEAGDFDQAVLRQTESLRAAPPDVQEALRERLKIYERREPFHRQPNWWR